MRGAVKSENGLNLNVVDVGVKVILEEPIGADGGAGYENEALFIGGNGDVSHVFVVHKSAQETRMHVAFFLGYEYL